MQANSLLLSHIPSLHFKPFFVPSFLYKQEFIPDSMVWKADSHDMKDGRRLRDDLAQPPPDWTDYETESQNSKWITPRTMASPWGSDFPTSHSASTLDSRTDDFVILDIAMTITTSLLGHFASPD